MKCLRQNVFGLAILVGFMVHAGDPMLRIGDKEYLASKATGFFDGSGYSVSWTGSGFQISFYGDSIIRSESETAISSGKDISICMSDGVTVIVDGRNSGISSGGNVVIKGPGTLNVLTRSVGLLNNNDGIRASGDVVITLGATVNVDPRKMEILANGCCLNAGGRLKIEGAIVTLFGYDSLLCGFEGINITASLLNLAQGSNGNYTCTAIESRGGDVKIVGSVLSLLALDDGISAGGALTIGESCVGVVSRGACFLHGAAPQMSFADSAVVAVSVEKNVVSLSGAGAAYPYPKNYYVQSENGSKVPETLYIGSGSYHFGAGTGRTCLMGGVNVVIEGGDIECCAPSGIGAYAYDFALRSGSFKMVNELDYKTCYRTIMAEAAILAIVSGVGAFEDAFALKSSLFVGMYEQFLLSKTANPKGAARAAIAADSFRQYGGEVDQGASDYGYIATKDVNLYVDTTSVKTPALVGGVFHGQMGVFGYRQDYKALHPTNRNGTAYAPTDGYPYWELSSPNRLIVFEPGKNGKGVPLRTSVRAKSVTTLPNQLFTRSGYRQTGWAEAEEGPQKYAFGQKLTVSSDLLLYPSWSPTFYTITYSGGGGVGSMPDQACEPHRVYRLQPNAFSADGVKMVGWRNMTSGKLYDDQLLVFDMAAAGETVAMMAEWDPQAKTYMIIDVSGGTDARSYPVSYRATVPEEGWSDEYKTDKIVLRKIKPGTFEKGLHNGDYPGVEPSYGSWTWTTTISKPYYIGVFEVTQRQWELVMGTRPSCFSNETYYAARPVERVKDSLILGADESFVDRLRAKTGMRGFGLPSEDEWEYACRAGTTTALNNGKNILSDGIVDEGANEVARYYGNAASDEYRSIDGRNCSDKSGTATVGSYQPNAWGLYDMHGNVYEYCRDKFTHDQGGVGTSGGESTSRSYFIRRGGSWVHDTKELCSGGSPSMQELPVHSNNFTGFRLYYSESESPPSGKPAGNGPRQ